MPTKKIEVLKKNSNFEEKNDFFSLYYNPLVSLENFNTFDPAVWPAIANIFTYMSEDLYYID